MDRREIEISSIEDWYNIRKSDFTKRLGFTPLSITNPLITNLYSKTLLLCNGNHMAICPVKRYCNSIENKEICN